METPVLGTRGITYYAGSNSQVVNRMPQRYQKEIQDILDQTNQHSRKRSGGIAIASISRIFGSVKALLRGSERSVSGSFSFWSPGGLLLLGAIAIILGWALQFLDVLDNLAGPVIWIGVISVIFSYVRYFTRQRNPVVRKWRQQVIDDNDLPVDGFWNSLKKFFQ